MEQKDKQVSSTVPVAPVMHESAMGPDTPALQAAGVALLEVFRRFRNVMRHPPSGHGKSGAMAVMKTVAFHQVATGEGIRISQIAAVLKIAPPTVTQFINGLERDGWVERRMDPNDRRSVLVFLTEEGMRIHTRFEADMLSVFRGLAAYVGLEDATELVRILNKSFGYMDELAKHHPPHDAHEAPPANRKTSPHDGHAQHGGSPQQGNPEDAPGS